MTYWLKYGKSEKLLDVLARAGTTYAYWKHICRQRRKPRLDLARRLADASGGELSLGKLLGVEPWTIPKKPEPAPSGTQAAGLAAVAQAWGAAA